MSDAAVSVSTSARPRSRRRALLITCALLFLAINGIAYVLAWSMTHYEAADPMAPDFKKLSNWQKVGRFAKDFAMPRPGSAEGPGHWAAGFSTLHYPGAKQIDLETWRVPGEEGRPIVLLFHGYNASKSSLTRPARAFHELGCETWLVDFHGSGGSAGTSTSIGYDEADDVAATVRLAQAQPGAKRPLVLYGVSMGSTAVLCAVHRFQIQPDELILETPFDRLVTTVGNRCKLLCLPSFPCAEMLVFWGGIQGGYNGFAHNPVNYARDVRCPTLLMQGDQDERVGFSHAREIAAALGDHCTFKVFPGARHIMLIGSSESEWRGAVQTFLDARKVAASNIR